jgi:hypothetical protein
MVACPPAPSLLDISSRQGQQEGGAMTSMTTDTRRRARQQGRQGWRSQVGMTAATLVLLGGAVLWQTRAHRGTTTEETVGSSPVAVAARPAGPAAVSDQEMFGRWQTGGLGGAAPVAANHVGAPETLYLVASEAAAAELRVLIDASGPPVAYRYLVMVVPTRDDAILRGLGAMDEVRADQGLPPIAVVDLRAR